MELSVLDYFVWELLAGLELRLVFETNSFLVIDYLYAHSSSVEVVWVVLVSPYGAVYLEEVRTNVPHNLPLSHNYLSH